MFFKRDYPASKATAHGVAVLKFSRPVHGNLMPEIQESDWKVLRRVHPLALERFCKRVLAEIARVSRDDAKSYHARYLQIFGLIQQDNRKRAHMFDNPRRSQALVMLAQIRSQRLLSEEEFSSLSPETRGAIQMLLGAGRKPHMAARSRFSTNTVIDSKYLLPWLSEEDPWPTAPTSRRRGTTSFSTPQSSRECLIRGSICASIVSPLQ
jgi:hypothetical protein